MKNLVYALAVLATVGLATKIWAGADEPINGVEAVKHCENQIQSIYAAEEEVQFSPRPTSSLSQGVYKFWINAIASSDEGRESRRYLCEITRYGDVLGLLEEDGRWK